MSRSNFLIITSVDLRRTLVTDSSPSSRLPALFTSERPDDCARFFLKHLRHFGREIVAARAQLPQDDEKVTTLWLKMYKVADIQRNETVTMSLMYISIGIHRGGRWYRQRHQSIRQRCEGSLPLRHQPVEPSRSSEPSLE